MTKRIIIWIAVMSILATALLFLFNSLIFQACYHEEVVTIGFQIAGLSPALNCIYYTLILAFSFLFFGPVILTAIMYAAYVLVFDRPMPNAKYIIWFLWFVFLYFVTFQVTMISAI